MSSETVAKKRGRPKKVDKTTSAATDEIKATPVTTPKQSTKSRAVSTAKTSSTALAPKKPSRRKNIADLDEIEDADGQPEQQIKIPNVVQKAQSIIKGPSSKTTILDEANAFIKLRDSAATSAQINASDAARQQSTKTSGTLSSDPNPPTSSSNGSPPTRTIAVPKSRLSSTQPKHSPSQSSDSVDSNGPRSSFLSGFLSDTPDSIPEAPESSKISDRSAFNSQTFSIDDIVSGAGVSDLTTLTAAIQKEASAKRARESAIPVKTPKTFKSHNLNAFPDSPQQQQSKSQPAQKYVNPETYALSSFRSLKTASTEATAPSDTTLGASTTTTQSPHIPPTTTMTQPHPPSHPQKISLKISSSPSPLQTQPTEQPQTQPHPHPHPHPQTTPFPSSTSTATPSSSSRPTRLPHPPQAAHPQPPSPPRDPSLLRPKRPTEMTQSELFKNPEFRSLRRKWTSLIVGVPVLVVTSWILWERLDKEEKEKNIGIVVEERRRRGEMPRRILDDGGLERQRERDEGAERDS